MENSPASEQLGIEWFEPDSPGASDRAGHVQPAEVHSELALGSAELTQQLVTEGRALGFARVGVTTAEPLFAAQKRLERFRERGFAGGMSYLVEGDRHDPRTLLPGVKSIVVGAFPHGDPSLVPLRRGPLAGAVARYAQGEDYHMKLKMRLQALGRRLATLLGQRLRGRVCVDTAPILERELAVRSGLGFQGKSTLVLTPGVGSYVLLAELLVEVELAPTTSTAGSCGSCRACLDACPTQAFPEAYVLDARRCLSYLTIEFDGVFPRELRRALGNRVFGCDVCQEVCPYNASPGRPQTSELGARPALRAPDLVGLLNLGSAPYRTLVRRTALRRVSRTTLQRNAAIALGNSDAAEAVAPLTQALRAHSRALVRAHVAWALGELCRHWDDAAVSALRHAQGHDDDPLTRDEAALALARSTATAR